MEQLLTFLVLLALGFGFGRWAEKRHYRSIHAREAILRGLIVVPDRMPPIQYQHYPQQPGDRFGGGFGRLFQNRSRGFTQFYWWPHRCL